MKDLTHGPAPGFWRMLWRTGGALPLILAVATVVMTLISFHNLRLGLAFEMRGADVIGEVVAREQRQRRTDNGTRTDHYLTIQFETPNEVVRKQGKVSRSLYQASPEGSTRMIRYLPDAPHKVEFVIGETRTSGHVMRWFALVLGIATLAAIWWRGGVAVAAIRSRKFGASEMGQVREVKRRKSKRSASYALIWTDARGEAGESLSSGSSARYAAYPVGSEIALFRDSTGRTWWVGDVGPRAEAPTVPSVGKSRV